MFDNLELILRPVFVVTALLYLGLSIRVARSSAQRGNSIIAFFLFLAGTLVAGSAFSYGADDPNLFGIGRTLSFFASGFLPVAFYIIYREYTVGPPGTILISMLSVVPIATTVLALTNPMHHIIWSVINTESGLRYTDLTEHYWLNRVHAPFMYGLFTYSVVSLLSRLSAIARAHRKAVVILVLCALLPFVVSISNNYLGMGPPDFPFTSLTVSLLLPVYWYVSITLRFYEFSPLAYETLFHHVRDPIIVLDTNDAIICTNRSAQEFLGASERELLGQQLWKNFPKARELLRQASELDLTQTLRMDNSHVYELSSRPLTGPKGQNLGMVVVCRDVTERRNALDKLADNEHLIRTLIETSSNGILRFARDTSDPGSRYHCVFANRSAENYLGCGTGTLVGVPLDKLQQMEPEKLIAHFNDDTRQRSSISFEVSTETAAGRAWLRISGEPIGEDFSVTLIDITQRKRNEDKMLADALRDPLTGMLNRRGFEKEGKKSVREHEMGAVLYLDLNQFKSINDRFGHQAGDALLKAFGHRLEFCLRPEDVLGRLGGDEFAIVLPGVSVEDAKHIAERLVITASDAYIIQGKEIRCTASVGISLIPQHGEDLWHLINVADEAMYNAKSLSQAQAANDRSAYIEAATAR
ncbi:MAG: diguanylate cyclase [Gammaproteobacteria bacterium]|nr:diguanylate cyclase [Gammaproteobacteria bacterium]MDH5304236.1 diguanylate cyclase [Gammaproteobacteria bacterium]MDH5321429.1 diguanylate cyclase [Gammaproteobacteria bacterium]